ncbi:MAG: cysteine desulfurase NifS, partial [Phycisphaerae bacterium]|nr:cysteine desulfurase NifS [Phycisphaerae bacterium]
DDLSEVSDHEVLILPNDSCGRVDLAALNDLISARADEIGFVSIMAANNETGVIQPIKEIGEACRSAGIPFHSDATQWVGKLPLDVHELCVDMISFAGHKFHGPKGSGVLWLREGMPLHAMVQGGGQERRRRGGTESVADIVGLGVACRAARHWLESGGASAMEARRTQFETRIQERIPSVCINAREGDRVWSTSNIGFPTVEAELMLLGLSEAGLCASAGSACSSGALKKSSVIGAIGRQPCQASDQPYGSVRFSFDRLMEPSMLDSAVDIIVEVFGRLQQVTPGGQWPLDACEATGTDRL